MTAVADVNARRDRIFRESRDYARAGGRGYSRMVRSLRLILPLLAGGVLALAILWPLFQNDSATFPGVSDLKLDAADAREVRMRSPRLVGVDDVGRPYELSAAEARQGDEGLNTVLLDRPAGEIVLEDGARLSMEAGSGVFNREAERLELSGSVKLEHGLGYTFQSPSATVDLHRARAEGDQPIRGSGPEGEIQGEGFEILDKGRTVKILGKSRLLITRVPEQP